MKIINVNYNTGKIIQNIFKDRNYKLQCKKEIKRIQIVWIIFNMLIKYNKVYKGKILNKFRN